MEVDSLEVEEGVAFQCEAVHERVVVVGQVQRLQVLGLLPDWERRERRERKKNK